MWTYIASLCLGAVLLTQAAQAHGTKTKTIEIVHPWTRETAGAIEATVEVYMTIKNRGRAADRLLGVETPLAKSVEIMDLPEQGDMRRVDRIAIEAGESTELLPSGAKLRLTGVARPLPAYDTFPMTLIFEHAGRIMIEVLVEEGAAPASRQHTH